VNRCRFARRFSSISQSILTHFTLPSLSDSQLHLFLCSVWGFVHCLLDSTNFLFPLLPSFPLTSFFLPLTHLKMAVSLQAVADLLSASLDPRQNRQGRPSFCMVQPKTTG
jgi:hypothetical protein